MVADTFKYYALTEYQEQQPHNLLLKSYNSYNKSSNGITSFIFYDITSESYMPIYNSDVTSPILSQSLYSSQLTSPIDNKEPYIFEKEIKYKGSLKITINEFTHELYIEELPIIEYGFDEFPVFTSDILELIKKCIKIYGSIVELAIIIRPQVFAFSPEVGELIKESYSYQMSNSVFQKTKKIKESLANSIAAEKTKQKEQDARIEREIERRRRTFGLLREDYKTEEEYRSALNEKVKEYSIRKRNHCLIQYDINMDHYVNSIIDMYQEESHLSSVLKMFGIVNDSTGELICKKYDDEEDPQKKEIVEKILSYYLTKHKIELEREIIKKFPLIREKKDENDYAYKWDIRLDRSEELSSYDDEYDEEDEYDEDEFLVKKPKDKEKIREIAIKLSRDYCYSLASKLDKIGVYLGDTSSYNPEEEVQAAIEKRLNYLLACQRLWEKISYYTKIIDNPESFVDFSSNKKLISMLMECPVFFKFAFDYYHSYGGEVINLLMIKPGTIDINLDNLRCFASPDNSENFGRYKADSAILSLLHSIPRKKQEYHEKYVHEFIKDKNYSCERLIITIPNSMPKEKIRELILFGFKYAKDRINFICEGIDPALYIKEYIVLEELNAQKQGESIIGDMINVFVNIDPDYYQNYCLTTPTNRSLFKRYGYNSDYKYSRKTLMGLKGAINTAIAYNREINYGFINWNEVEEHLLGYYTNPDYCPYTHQEKVEQEMLIIGADEERAKTYFREFEYRKNKFSDTWE